MSFIAYYFHWSEASVLQMEHAARRKWCREISDINKSLAPSDKEREKNKRRSIFTWEKSGVIR